MQNEVMDNVNTVVQDTEDTSLDELLQLVSFRIGEELYGVDILIVQEINRYTEITKVPQAPDFVEGMMNLRGRVIPIIDLRKRFGMDLKEHDKDTRIVVVDIKSSVLGMIVDSVSEVLRIPSNTVEPAPDIATSVSTEYIRGVAKLEDRLLILLELTSIFSDVERELISGL